MSGNTIVPVLEVGGTHLTAALVESGTWAIDRQSLARVGLQAQGTAESLIEAIGRAADALTAAPGAVWSVAIPGPFDYATGIGRFEHVGKFDSLNGVDVRDALMDRISPTPGMIHFLNDADAFGVGEYALGAARGHERALCITLGTGVGSTFLNHGEPVSTGPAVSPDGSIHHETYRGSPLERTVSRRAIRAAYAAAAGVDPATGPDVHTIAAQSRAGDDAARQVLDTAFGALGETLAVVLKRFDASILVIGGSMAGSWDLVEPAIRAGMTLEDQRLADFRIEQAILPDDAALVGAAYWASRQAAHSH
ncbi:glucokinase [Arthrobacter sp. CAN_A212]|uniref:ROK family protein n=1 Tax=unclassified Arthrobacter TaxID=235627 RepID=UPI0018C9DDCC|nr:ROK family protein [Arthrobacter sp. CAN_C5]MBP2218484.1 glucokinase [Arthrobacter sp. CAN_C5]